MSYENSLSILFSQSTISLCSEKMHMMEIVVVFQQKKDNERNLSQDLFTIENIDSNFKLQALHYAKYSS